ncbi:MAG: hypothetical protein ACTSUO_07235 [Candidatus Thorarchaeota archaeon]
MSVDIPERSEIVRSTIITVLLASIFLIIGVLFWFWNQPDAISPIAALSDANPYLLAILEVLSMFAAFIFITVTIVNLRLFYTQIRAGWLDVIVILVIMVAVTYVMFQESVALFTLLFNLGFLVYLYLLQE